MNKKDKELELRILDLDNKEDELNKIERNLGDKNKEIHNIKRQKTIINKTNNVNKCIKTQEQNIAIEVNKQINSYQKYLDSKTLKSELNIKKQLIYDKLKDITDIECLIRVIENEEELQNALSPGALKLEILEKKERKVKHREKELRETNNNLKIKIEEYNKKILELQNL